MRTFKSYPSSHSNQIINIYNLLSVKVAQEVDIYNKQYNFPNMLNNDKSVAEFMSSHDEL
ncbi:MAG: hypothetical protein ACI8VC_001484 [Candidatus Endobugula sp.]|jgi:hypothetical protein